MMRLNSPTHSFDQIIDACSTGISGNPALHSRLMAGKPLLLAGEAEYLGAASVGELFSIPPLHAARNTDPVVVGELTKSDLIKIYDQYLVPEEKPARSIYDALMNAAKEKCPFCGGIGTPRTLDHFLPKAHFPKFSILPWNLVPSCRDCNMDGKAHSFASSADEQLIHPYADRAGFFEEQWIFARYPHNIAGQPGEFEYFVSPPTNWDEVDRKRANKHFRDFDIAKRYATKAGEPLGTILNQIQSMRAIGLGVGEINSVLLTPGVERAPFINHWQRGMYQALMNALI